MYLKQGIPRLLSFLPDHELGVKDRIHMFPSNSLNTRLEEEKKLFNIDLSICFTKECLSRNTYCKPFEKEYIKSVFKIPCQMVGSPPPGCWLLIPQDPPAQV